MVQKRVVIAILVLALAVLACSIFSGRGEDPNVALDSDGQVSGEQAFQNLGCSGCHESAAGKIAPSLENVYGKEVLLESGEKVVADDVYLRESILSPGEKIVAGFQPVMPDFSSQISDRELEALIEYIRSLSD